MFIIDRNLVVPTNKLTAPHFGSVTSDDIRATHSGECVSSTWFSRARCEGAGEGAGEGTQEVVMCEREEEEAELEVWVMSTVGTYMWEVRLGTMEGDEKLLVRSPEHVLILAGAAAAEGSDSEDCSILVCWRDVFVDMLLVCKY